MRKVIMLIVLSFVVPAVGWSAGRNVHFEGDFESGSVQPNSSTKDGFFIHTLPNPQKGTSDVSGGRGGFGPNAAVDTRVVTTEKVGSETVKPRKGKYFIRSALYRNKNYAKLNSGKNKPRSKIYMNHSKNMVNFDEEGYLGFSVFLPKNWEHETGVRGNPGEVQLLQVQAKQASSTLLHLGVYVPKGKSVAHWTLTHFLTDKSTKGGKKDVYDLGPVSGDLGVWTDFVLRYRFNPFSKSTKASTISGGDSKTYAGNKGILQLWKSSGSIDGQGNRKMALTAVNIQDKPVGLVPPAKAQIDWHFRAYKYGWHNQRTAVNGPVWVGFDEIRDGRVLANGTSFKDVHPGGLACPSGCSKSSANGKQPSAPSKLVVVN